MPMTPDDIVDRVNGMSDHGKAGMFAASMMESAEGYGGPYSSETRDWIERFLADECSYNRIMQAKDYALRMMGVDEEFALSTDEGENLLDDNDLLMETYRE